MIYYVKLGDTISKIAERFNTTVENILEANEISNQNYVLQDQRLIIPENKSYSIEINTTSKTLKLLKNNTIIKQYPVAVGKSTTPTPKGNFYIIKKGLWGNQFGGHFMQLNVPYVTYGIHGTNKPWSIGKAISNGCIRMYSSNASELYSLIAIGTPVRIY